MIATKQKMIRLGIDGGSLVPSRMVRGGIERLVDAFIKSLAHLHSTDKSWFYYFFSNKKENFKNDIYSPKQIPEKLYSTVFLPLYIFFDKIDIYLGFSGVLPQLIRVLKKKSIIFIHDLAFYETPQNYKDPARMRWQTEYALFGSDKIVVFSDHIKKQIFTRFPTIRKEKVVRIYPGSDHIKKQYQTIKNKGLYFLYVGVIKKAKNIEHLLECFNLFLLKAKDLSVKLILVGSREENYYRTIIDSPIYQKTKNNIVFAGTVSDEELAGYYKGAIAVLNVSSDEGFCYPVIEGLVMEKHVIVNDIPLYKEFQPFFLNLHIEKNTLDFISRMHSVMTLPKPKKPNSNPFTWSTFTKEVLQVIDKLI